MLRDKVKVAQFVRFCVVGIGNTVADLGLFWLLSRAGAPYLMAQVLSYSAGVLNSYLLNRTWTFRVTGKIQALEATKFVLVNVLSLLASTGVLFALHDGLHLNLGVAKVAAMGSAPVINFIGNLLWVFTANKTRGETCED